MIRRKRALSAGLLALALAGPGAVTATAERHPTLGQPTSKAPAVPVVDCQTRLQLLPGNDPPSLQGRNYIAAGPVNLTAWFRDEPRAELEPPPGRAERIKAPIFVDAGAAVTISLSGASAERAEIDIGLDQGGSARGPSVRFVPCPPDATVAGRRVGRRTPFIGGYRVAGPMCLRLQVLADGAAEPIRKLVPFGKGSCRAIGT